MSLISQMSFHKGSSIGCGPSDDRSPITDHSVRAAFTLVELLIVIGITAVLLVLIAPAFTYIKGGTDVTSAAYTIKGVLETARTYAKFVLASRLLPAILPSPKCLPSPGPCGWE